MTYGSPWEVLDREGVPAEPHKRRIRHGTMSDRAVVAHNGDDDGGADGYAGLGIDAGSDHIVRKYHP